ncbi:hypothetical protein JXB27_04130 [Candidatus Woesearchaeota archaeon]|nr:hypothetical protein [Candidatus Woesearchaeota archaeon]
MEKGELTKILKWSEVSLTVNSYNDIFSSFDSRPYHERALSVDFIDEAKRASRDKALTGLELNLLVPKKTRDEYCETVIKDRLKEHFRKSHHVVSEEKRSTVNLGIKMVMLGILFMFTATFLLFEYGNKNLIMSFFIVLLEPAGWFTFWEGLNKSVFEAKNKNPEIEFYRKMTNAEIRFKSY